MPTEAESEAFVAELKVALPAMTWRSRGSQAADIAVIGLVIGGLRAGEVICRQMPGYARYWGFTLRDTRDEHLRWDYVPETKARRHRNVTPLPPGYESKVTAAVHEHYNLMGRYPRLSIALIGKDTQDHRQALDWFCDRANIDASPLQYAPPPNPQLTLPVKS